MLNYSKEQYDKDRKKMNTDNRRILSEKFKSWSHISKKCSISHIVNPTATMKAQVAKNKEIENQIAISIIKFVKSIKKKPLDQTEIKV